MSDIIITDRFVVEEVYVPLSYFSYPDDFWDEENDYEKMIKELIEQLKGQSMYWEVTDRISQNSIPIIDEEEAELLCGLLNSLPESYLIEQYGDSDVYVDDTLEKEFTIIKI